MNQTCNQVPGLHEWFPAAVWDRVAHERSSWIINHAQLKIFSLGFITGHGIIEAHRE